MFLETFRIYITLMIKFKLQSQEVPMNQNRNQTEEETTENNPLTKWTFEKEDPTDQQVDRILSILAV